MRRFREYEAYIGMIYKVPAATLVLCTSIEISERICRGMDILENPGLDMKEEDVKSPCCTHWQLNFWIGTS